MKTKYVLLLALFVGFGTMSFGQGKDPLMEQGSQVFKMRTPNDFKEQEGRLNPNGKAALAKARQELAANKNAKFTVGANEILNVDPKGLLGLGRPETPNPAQIRQMEMNNEAMKSKIEAELRLKNISADFTYLNLANINWNQLLFGLGCTWNTSILTPVKNQNPCGSCWAFAAAATWEHTYRKFYGTGTTPDLSEEDMVNCGRTNAGVDAGSCGGGWTDRALNYVQYSNVARESDYPYTATNAACMAKPKTYGAFYYGQLYPGRFPTVNEVKAYVTTYGAVATYMRAGLSSFFGYAGGVYNGYASNASNDVDHAVTIVGWCDDKNAWIIKNSWGNTWGPYGGYAYVDYNSCNIGKYVFYVYPKP